MKRLYTAIICATMVASLCLAGSENQTASDMQKLLEQLRKGEVQAKQALEAFHGERRKIIDVLISFVSENVTKEKEKPVLHEVIKIMGVLRAPEFIDVLRNNMFC